MKIFVTLLSRFVDWMQARSRARQRKLDLHILWPLCKEMAPDLYRARAAFALHAMNEEAWTADYTNEELVKFLEELA